MKAVQQAEKGLPIPEFVNDCESVQLDIRRLFRIKRQQLEKNAQPQIGSKTP